MTPAWCELAMAIATRPLSRATPAGQTAAGVDVDQCGAAAARRGYRLPVDFAAANLVGIEGHAREPVRGDAVELGGDQCFGCRRGVGFRRAGGYEDAKRQVA